MDMAHSGLGPSMASIGSAAIISIILANFVSAACSPGLVAVIAVNSNLSNKFSFVVLQPLDKYSKLFFTDNEWTGTALTAEEGTVAFNASRALPAGTVVTYTDAFPGSDPNGLWEKTSGSYSFANNDDQLFAYCGDSLNPEFVYGFSTKAWLTADATLTSSDSFLPEGLMGANVVVVSTFNNVYYNGITTGVASELLAQINLESTWKGSVNEYIPTDSYVILTPYPSAVPTNAPTSDPTDAPTRLPTGVPATWMIFESFILVEGVDDLEATQPASTSVLVDTMADVLPYLRKDHISIVSFIPASTNRRFLKSVWPSQHSTLQSYQARYSTRVVLEELGYTSSQATAAYDMMKADIEEAVGTGQFNLFFDKHSNESDILCNASVPRTQSVTFSDYVIADIALIGDEANTFIENGVIAFTVIVALAGAGFVVMFLYYYRQRDVSFKLYMKRSKTGKVPSIALLGKVCAPARVSEFSEDSSLVKNPLADDL